MSPTHERRCIHALECRETERDLAEAQSAVSRLQAEVERLRAAQQWQPIDTAPRDGTWIAACYLGDDRPVMVFWADHLNRWRDQIQSFSKEFDYWMPIPPSPQEPRT